MYTRKADMSYMLKQPNAIISHHSLCTCIQYTYTHAKHIDGFPSNEFTHAVQVLTDDLHPKRNIDRVCDSCVPCPPDETTTFKQETCRKSKVLSRDKDTSIPVCTHIYEFMYVYTFTHMYIHRYVSDTYTHVHTHTYD